MQYCHYHPLQPATWYCSRCHIYSCDVCNEESSYQDERRCFSCGSNLESLGAAYTAVPFWRRMKEFFRYPFNWSTMGLIVGVSVIAALLSFVPIINVVAMLLMAGIFTKYSFICLDETANGNMRPPDIVDAYEGGLILILKMILLLVAVVFGSSFLVAFVGPGVMGFLGMLMLMAVPAFLINYALTDSILQAIHPARLLRLITAIGMPYGILIGLLMLMGSSVNVLSYLLINDWQWLNVVLESVIANYYMVVMFHMMGYVVFQYQEELGFYARGHGDETLTIRTDEEKTLAHISVAVKDGDYDKVMALYQQRLHKDPDNRVFNDGFFEFLYRTHKRRLLADFAQTYLGLKLRKGYKDKLNLLYKQVLQVVPDFVPADAELRYQIAVACAAAGDFMAAVKLINGMHKQYSEDKHMPLLIRSYTLMATALDALEKPEQAQKCRQLIRQFEKITSSGGQPLPKPQSV